MATIVNLSDYRRPQAQQRNSPSPDAVIRPGPHYFCTRCETDRFKLFSSGTIHCASCGAMMRNIQVAESKDKAGSSR